MNRWKKVRLTINLDLLCTIWNTRTDKTQNLDDRITELLAKGIDYQHRETQQ